VCIIIWGSWRRSVSIVTRLWAGQSGVQIPDASRFFSSPKRPDCLSASCSMGTGRCLLRVQQLDHEIAHTPPSNAEV
jgi:hypothetical protein